MATSVLGVLRSSLRKAVDRYPSLTEPIGRVWNTYEHVRFTYAAWKHDRQYGDEPAPVDPYRVIWIDPAAIEYHSPAKFHFLSEAGTVEDGDWDRGEKRAITERFRYRSFYQRFVDGHPWEETEFYRKKVQKIRSDESAKYESVEALERKCDELDAVFQDMKDHGYRTQAEVAEETGSMRYVGDGGPGLLPWRTDSIVRHEVSIDLARDGEPFLNEGRHRLSMAKILELERVPVRVVARHREWQNTRNAVARFLESEPRTTQRELRKAIEEDVFEDQAVVMGASHPDIHTLVDDHLS